MARIVFALSLMFVFVWVDPVDAANLAESSDEFRVGPWHGRRIYNRSGRFSYCLVSAHYRNGHNLLFAVHRDDRFAVGVSNPTWNAHRGRRFEVLVSIDGRSMHNTIEIIGEHTFLMWQPAGTFEAFQRGRWLRIASTDGSFRVRFSLRGTQEALDRLLACVGQAPLRRSPR